MPSTTRPTVHAPGAIQDRVRQRREKRMDSSEIANDPQEPASLFSYDTHPIPFFSPNRHRRLPQQSDAQKRRAHFQGTQRHLSSDEAGCLRVVAT